MATFIDIHDIPGVKAGDVVGAHEADVRVGPKFGVDYQHYWVDEAAGKVFCLVEAPDREAAIASTARPTASSPSPCSRSRRAPRG